MYIMNQKRVVRGTLIVLVLLSVSIGIFIFTHTPGRFTIDSRPTESRTRPQAGTKSSENLGKVESTDPWEAWIQEQADAWIKASADQLRSGKTEWTEASLRESIVTSLRENMEEIKEKNDGKLPAVDDTALTLGTRLKTSEKYTGPQNPAALMEAFHSTYTKNGTRHLDQDENYPPEPFLQMLLDKGVSILDSSEYKAFMSLRGIRKSFEKSGSAFVDMQVKRFGIPASDIDALEAAFIDSEIPRRQQIHELMRTDHNITGGVSVGNPNNRTHLPFYHDRNITYVKRSKSEVSFSSVFMGTPLTETQKFNLLFKGIEPEGIDIIYVDELGKRFEEKPPPITREEFLNFMPVDETPPPEDWWNLDAPASDDFGQNIQKNDTELTRDVHVQQAEAALQVEQEKFQQVLRQFEEFSNMSDAEFKVEIERLLTLQLPELPSNENIEQEIVEKVAPKQITPERFEKALEIINQYGPEEGLRKIAMDDPELAKYFLNRQKQAEGTLSRSPNTNNQRSGDPE